MASKKNNLKTSDNSMKLIIAIVLLIAFIGGYMVARAKYKPQILILNRMITERDNTMQKMKADANKVAMKDGKMWIVENGIVQQMESDMLMPNGVKVMQDGKVISTNGEERMMQNGDGMDMDGNMMPNGGADLETTSPSF